MLYADFVYDTISSDEFGVKCISFSPVSGAEKIPMHNTNLNQELAAASNEFKIVSQTYSQPLTFTFQLMNRDERPISPAQERAIKKWLLKKAQYAWFTILEPQYADLWFKANISNPKNIVVMDVSGLEFTVTCSTPFAYSDLHELQFTATKGQPSLSLYVDNDEAAYIYPSMAITMAADGDFEIKNSREPDKNKIFSIKGLRKGEIITLDGSLPHMSSSIKTHNLYDKFSFHWPYLIDGENHLSFSQPCEVSLTYRETRKVGVN